jgi:hypothetical protein
LKDRAASSADLSNSLETSGGEEEDFAGDEIDTDTALLVTPDTGTYTEHLVATRWIADYFFYVIIGLADFQLVVVLKAELAATGTEQGEGYDDKTVS